jgi:hypothetical protein
MERLLDGLSEREAAMLLDHIDRLTAKAEAMLAAERDLG